MADETAAQPFADNKGRSLAQRRLDAGAEYPFDAPDNWREKKQQPPPARDWAHVAARGVISDLQDRRGVKKGFRNIDESVRTELVADLAEIIRLAQPL